ncbi:MAG: hypothetical protein ACPIOQ_12780 [Promethearchaeia archaeon]
MIVSGADGRGSAGTGAGLLLRVRVCASRQLRAFELLPHSPEPVCVTGLASLRMARKHGVGWSCGRAAAWQRLSAANALLAKWGACGMYVCRGANCESRAEAGASVTASRRLSGKEVTGHSLLDRHGREPQEAGAGEGVSPCT